MTAEEYIVQELIEAKEEIEEAHKTIERARLIIDEYEKAIKTVREHADKAMQEDGRRIIRLHASERYNKEDFDNICDALGVTNDDFV